jgi:epoxide hydrolase-like predicted phosphatase
MTIKNLFIDFGGVIVRTEDRLPRNRAAEKLSMTTRELEKIIFESESSLRASQGEIPEEAHWQSVAEALRLNRSKADEITTEFFAGDRVDEMLVAYLREQRQDHKVALISNAWSGLRAFITRKGFVDVFDHMIISAEVGIMKPDPRIYQLALEELEAKADESVFIDDVLVNVDSARSIGMLGIQFNQPKQVLSELKNLLNNHR